MNGRIKKPRKKKIASPARDRCNGVGVQRGTKVERGIASEVSPRREGLSGDRFMHNTEAYKYQGANGKMRCEHEIFGSATT